MRHSTRRDLLAWLTAAAILLVPAAAAHAGQAAVLTGRVADVSGTPVGGATVSAVSASLVGRSQSTTTDAASGMYRFPSLPPGMYIVVAERDGLTPARHENVTLGPGRTATIDLTLMPGGLPGTVMISDKPPVIDSRASSAHTRLPREALEFLPFTSRFGPAAMLLAPGIHPTSYAAYGSAGAPANAYLIDGVDLSDPERGTIWVFTNHNWIEDVQIIGLGANAEYGGFTGVASNTILRSGSSVFHGLAETLYRPGWLTGSNIPAGIEQAHPHLAGAGGGYVTDSTLQAGGAISKDRLWYFAGAQYHRARGDGRVTRAPRVLVKPSLRAGDRGRLTGFLEFDRYTVDLRDSGLPAWRHDSPQTAWNTSYTHVLSPSSVLDIAYAGFTGHYRLTGGDTVEAYDAHRSRNQVNASVTQFASGFAGAHALKAGGALERSGLGHSRHTRVSAYAQDSWQPAPRLTLNPGIRLDHLRGLPAPFNDGALTTTSWGPRMGFAYDLSGTARTVVTGHWGRYVDALTPAHDGRLAAPIQPGRQPRVDQATLGLQHQVISDLSVGATAIHRRYEHSIDGMDGSYRGIELLAAKPFSSRTMLQASWVVGTSDRSTGDGVTHLLKVLGLWRGPFRIVASTAYVRAPGQTLPGVARQRLGERDAFFGVPGGLERMDAASRLDMKLERQVDAGYRRRLGLTLEGFNLFNSSAISWVEAGVEGERLAPAAINPPRQIRLGAVLRF
jgi:hypothetical protein